MNDNKSTVMNNAAVQQLRKDDSVTGDIVLQSGFFQLGQYERIAEFPQLAGVIEYALMCHKYVFSLISNLCQEKNGPRSFDRP